MNDEIMVFEFQARLCQTLGQSIRLRIINLLKGGAQCVSSIAESLDVPQPTVSRYLKALRAAGVLTRRRRGAEVFYEISSPKIVEVCEMMRNILSERENHRLKILNALPE